MQIVLVFGHINPTRVEHVDNIPIFYQNKKIHLHSVLDDPVELMPICFPIAENPSLCAVITRRGHK